jgi:iron complex outermembrane receptor protein
VGATARILGPLSVRASGGRTFRAPSFAELFLEQGFVAPNPDLAPEQAWSADAALVVDGRLGLASAGAFLTLYDDVIVYQPASFQRVKPFNAGKVAARGVELELASARYTRAGLSALLAFTWLGTEQLRGDPAVIGKELPHRAPLRLFARVEADPGPVAAHVEVHHVGAQWNDLRNVQRIAPALVLNAGLAARLVRRPDLRAHVEVRNLLDDRTLTDGFLNPLPGRTVMVTLRMSGGKESP